MAADPAVCAGRSETKFATSHPYIVRDTKRKFFFWMPVALAAAITCVAAEPQRAAAQAPSARVDNARIFPFFASGGGWESTISLVNIADQEVNYMLTFYGMNGQRTRVTVRDRNNQVLAAETIQGRLNDDGGDTFVLLDTGVLQAGWAVLDYDGDNRLAGTLVFRQRVTGRPDFEASVGLARNDETRFWIPFDNTQGYSTSMAITNPSMTDLAEVQLRFWDLDGREILTRELRLGPGTTVAFSLTEQYPELNGRVGQARAETSDDRLSAIALRFNSSGAFTTVPVSSR